MMQCSFSGILVRYCRTDAPAGLQPSASQSGEAEDQLHVNLWEVVNGPLLDLGIMVNDWKVITAVQVDLPWAVDIDDLTDLGSRLNSEKTVAAIFNEVVHYNGSADMNWAEVSFRPSDYVGFNPQNDKNHGHFVLLRLTSKAFDVVKLRASDGTESTQLRVRLPVLQGIDPKRIYLRFRIKNVPRSLFASVFRQRDRHLLSSSTETRIIDFRINVRRGVSEEILSSDKNVWFPQFKKIHFFLTIDKRLVCDFESQSFVGCRSLFDEEIWNDYISMAGDRQKASVKEYLGYQWTAAAQTTTQGAKPTPVKDLVVLGRFSGTSSSRWYIARFVVLGLIFGMVGNGLWDILRPTEGPYLAGIVAHWRALVVLLAALIIAGILVALPFSKESSGLTHDRSVDR